MVDVGPAEEARKGLLGSLAGKAKEVAGAVIGNDSLTAEGQLQQAEAHARKDAATKDAVAQAEAQEATAKLQRETELAEREARAAETTANVREEGIVRDAQIDLVKAEADAERQRITEQVRIEAETQADLQRTAT